MICTDYHTDQALHLTDDALLIPVFIDFSEYRVQKLQQIFQFFHPAPFGLLPQNLYYINNSIDSVKIHPVHDMINLFSISD